MTRATLRRRDRSDGPVAVTVRQAGPDDAESLTGLLAGVRQLHAFHESAIFKAPVRPRDLGDHFRVAINEPRSRVLLADSPDGPLGYVSTKVQRYAATALVLGGMSVPVREIAVRAEVLRIGVGWLLLGTVEADARAKGIAGIVLGTWRFDEDAQRFFRAAGHEPSLVSMRKGVGPPAARP